MSVSRFGVMVGIGAAVIASVGGASAGTVAADPGAVSRTADSRPIVVIGASISTGYEVEGVVAYPRMISAIAGRSVYLSARSGAGYNDGAIAGLTRAANLPERDPALVVVQAGSNDVGASTAAIDSQVRQVIAMVRSQAPRARVALITVFPSVRGSGPNARATEAAIVGAARAVEPSVSVISPLSEGWVYGTSSDGHPDAAAHQKLAERVAALA
ncbi:SGNH/GDSL hydrolase family protein [Tsukamurella ocularis]|uniref:SGNH/GDSL hydrolase family protein n=1 Tax=Tsukamurella ocularis TaxID=1970234 RepID=UPI00216A2D1C|nr:SGNH/GDSL hydrolase family protein [Tsukamurella ocularis]MCS3781353.1 lysophospholipase L1-like esterase [Tsukamurella ocularis]MCS3787724.1 lysophospholipase L1-like esterase [Tsukamurella ocularis]MCS3851019.1 lysophospholipase L1-like esterase [Tsukamurella ocularis]